MKAVLHCLSLAVLVAGIQATAPGQSGSRETAFSVDVPLVTVTFSVRDRSGRLIQDLAVRNLRVFEDGVEQEVTFFGRVRALPLTLGIVVDRSPSQISFEDRNASTAEAFVRATLQPGDRVFLAAFDNKIKQLHPLTGSAEGIEDALQGSDKAFRQSARIGPKVRRKGGSAVLDAAYWSARERLAGERGRKALIMIGDGRENSSKVSLNDTIELLQSSDVVFYGLDNGGADSERHRRYTNVMPKLAVESGGRVIRVDEQSLAEAFAEIEAELRAFYTLGYITSSPQRDGRFRKISIQHENADYRVRARPGYVAR